MTLNGTWQATQAELASTALPPAVVNTIILEIADGRYTMQNDSGTIHQHAGNKLEIKGEQGPNNGKTILAIWQLEGNDLKICYDLSGKSYPEEFKTTPDTKLFLVTFIKTELNELL